MMVAGGSHFLLVNPQCLRNSYVVQSFFSYTLQVESAFPVKIIANLPRPQIIFWCLVGDHPGHKKVAELNSPVIPKLRQSWIAIISGCFCWDVNHYDLPRFESR